jgi:hypothetical protein
VWVPLAAAQGASDQGRAAEDEGPPSSAVGASEPKAGEADRPRAGRADEAEPPADRDVAPGEADAEADVEAGREADASAGEGAVSEGEPAEGSTGAGARPVTDASADARAGATATGEADGTGTDPAMAGVEQARATTAEGTDVDDGLTEPGGDTLGGDIPIRFKLGGYFRTRFNWFGNVPVGTASNLNDDAADAQYMFMRLRLNPEVNYGSDPDRPIASLKMQIDALDNVVWGDNARLQSTPLFAIDPSATDIDGFELNDTLFLRRAWIEFLIPVGQIRIGRMPSTWGQKILVHDGNGLGEWGDPQEGSTFDRILFATRPISIYNALAKGDSRPTPLIFAFAYDKLVEDPIVADTDRPTEIDVGPIDNRFEARSGNPNFSFLTNNGDDVNEAVVALLWRDKELVINKASDELTLGAYFIYRWQNSTESDIYISDITWRFKTGLGPYKPSFYTEGEIVNIAGTSRGVALTGDCMDGVCNEGNANIWGAVGSVGFEDEGKWQTELELGFSSGDADLIGDDTLKLRPLNEDYRVGLLLYRVALAARSSNGFGETLRPLRSDGGVWNSKYIWPQFRYTVLPGIETHFAFLAAWADELTPGAYVNTRPLDAGNSCTFEGECFLGWEADFALRVKWGDNDVMRWDTEVGVMQAGDALKSQMQGLAKDWLWTAQTRIGMVF